MVKEGLKKILPVMQAFVEGKTIQRYDDKKDDWYDISPNANIDFCYDYRIKPEPKYRPFKSQEECWDEMLKHQPFGWLKTKTNGHHHFIGEIYSLQELFTEVLVTPTHVSVLNSFTVFDAYTFADGAPFGIAEEK